MADTLTGDESLILPEFDVPPTEPFALAREWLDRAAERGVREPWVAALATVGSDAGGAHPEPSVRMVLIKALDAHGLIFTTYTSSRKGRELAANPHASVVFYWRETMQQLKVDGVVEQLSDAESDRLLRRASAGGPGDDGHVAPGAAARQRGEPRRRGATTGGWRGGHPRDPPTGRGTGSRRRRSSSGTGEPTGCTVGWPTGARPTEPGRPHACSPDRRRGRDHVAPRKRAETPQQHRLATVHSWATFSTDTASRRRSVGRTARRPGTRCSPTTVGLPAPSTRAPPTASCTPRSRRMTQDELRGRTEALASSYLAQGVTFDFAGEERPFPLDAVPRVIEQAEWIARRSRASSSGCARSRRSSTDVYGAPERGARRRHPGRADHLVGALPPRRPRASSSANGVRIQVSGIDLIRDEHGEWRVLEDNVRVPSGVSYVISNRRVMAQTLPELFVVDAGATGRRLPAPAAAGAAGDRARAASTTRTSSCSRPASTTPPTSSTRCSRA